MIHTVFCAAADAAIQWQCDLLEYTWGRVRQPGELVRLTPLPSGAAAPTQRFARVVPTLAWSPHPYNGDAYPPYDVPASLLEWLFTERVDGTVLLVGPQSVFRSAMTAEAVGGHARASPWPGLPRGEGPFGLGPAFAFLDRYCVDRTLPLPAVALPLAIHASDLRRLAARWLELSSIIRAETVVLPGGPLPDADKVAYAIAAAEAGVAHAASELAVDAQAAQSAAPILDYRRPVRAAGGEIVWDADTGLGGERIAPDAAPPGTGREFLTLLADYAARRTADAELAFLRPCRRNGVREGRLLGSLFLDIPGRSDTVSLNASGAAIWGCCDGRHSLAEINAELEARYAMAPGSLRADVRAAIARLESIGAIRLEPV